MNSFNIPQSLLDAAKKVLLTEHELTRREVVAVDKQYKNEIENHKVAANKISGHIFGNADRITIPLHTEEHPTKVAVETHLHSNGFTGTDYANGLTLDRHGRATTIGKALGKSNAPKELVDKYAVHQKTYAAEKELEGKHDLQVVISKHPHDVIGMSHGTDWGLRDNEEHIGKDRPTQSCMKFGTYQHDNHMPHELNAGTHVAWLTHKGDHEAKEPLARITLRPYTNKMATSGEMYKSYSFHIPASSTFVKNATHMARDEDYKVEDAMDYALDMTMIDNDMPYDDHYHSTSTVKHPTENKYTTTVHFNKPLSMDAIHEVHDGIASETGLYHPIDTSLMTPHKVEVSSHPEHSILSPGSKIYGQHLNSFANTVKAWTDTYFKPKDGETYYPEKGIYLDGDSPTLRGK